MFVAGGKEMSEKDPRLNEDPALFCKVNRAENPDAKTPLEQKHTPVITVPEVIKADEFTPVRIKVGEITHPNENAHFIQWVELYLNDVYLARYDFTAVVTSPEVEAKVKFIHSGLKAKLRAIARCNVHGLWEGTKDITVS
jgi:superoxide reductase